MSHADELIIVALHPCRFEYMQILRYRRHRNVVAASWRPYGITRDNICSTDGLLKVM